MLQSATHHHPSNGFCNLFVIRHTGGSRVFIRVRIGTLRTCDGSGRSCAARGTDPCVSNRGPPVPRLRLVAAAAAAVTLTIGGLLGCFFSFVRCDPFRRGEKAEGLRLKQLQLVEAVSCSVALQPVEACAGRTTIDGCALLAMPSEPGRVRHERG